MRIALRRLLPGVLGAALGAACSAPSAPPPDDIQLKPVDDSVITAPAPEDGDESQGGPPVPRPADARAEVDATCAKAATFVVGGELETTANLNLRSGPSTSDSVIRVLALGTRVLVLAPEPVDTFVRVRHAGSDGWVSVRFVTRIGPAPMSTCADASGGGADGGVISSARSTALQIAASGVGYSFWPGNAKWPQAKPTGSSAGSCAGVCPNCTHAGDNGADAAGFVAKAWQVPASNSSTTVNARPYSAAEFAAASSEWAPSSRERVRPGDVFVYSAGNRGHAFVYESADPWGAMWVYEARGCEAGIVHNLRTAGADYRVIARKGF